MQAIFKAYVKNFKVFLEGREGENCTQEEESKINRWVEKKNSIASRWKKGVKENLISKAVWSTTLSPLSMFSCIAVLYIAPDLEYTWHLQPPMHPLLPSNVFRKAQVCTFARPHNFLRHSLPFYWAISQIQTPHNMMYLEITADLDWLQILIQSLEWGWYSASRKHLCSILVP